MTMLHIMCISDSGTTSRCGANDWECRNGQCISKDFRCDSDRDCQDGSDEDDCFT